MRGDLEGLLYSKVKDHLQMRFGTTIQSLQQKGEQVRATFSDGTDSLFDLVIGADGVHSQIRQLVFGKERRFSRSLGYYTAAFVLENPPWSLTTADAFYTLTVPERQIGLYPIRGGRLATLFIYKTHRPINNFSFEMAVQELHQVYGGMDWLVPEILERCDRPRQ
jgi:2-polyprenyl-6-methoxyphenol hydroxylase-like FAD-dependent oxidoreductase